MLRGRIRALGEHSSGSAQVTLLTQSARLSADHATIARMVNDDPLGVLEVTGFRMVWLDDLDGDVFVIEECRVVLADRRLTEREVADALWDSLVEQLVS